MVIKKYDEVSNKCGVCLKTVYAAEEKLAGGFKWHKGCFKCSSCNKRLDSTTCNENGGSLYCKVTNIDNMLGNNHSGIISRLATDASSVPRAMDLAREPEPSILMWATTSRRT